MTHSTDDGDGTGVAGFGWAAYLLPHLQQQALYKNFKLPVGQLHDVLTSPAGRELAQVQLESFRCPSDTGYFLNQERPFGGTKYADLAAAKSNYIGNHGTRFVTLREKLLDRTLDSFGVLGPDSLCSEAHISDGTSNTILAGERRSAEDWAGVWIGVRNYNSDGDTGLRQVLGVSNVRINSRDGTEARRGFSSEHPGDALFAFADGHVEFIDEDIDFNQSGATSKIAAEKSQMGLYQRMLRRNDGQINVRVAARK